MSVLDDQKVVTARRLEYFKNKIERDIPYCVTNESDPNDYNDATLVDMGFNKYSYGSDYKDDGIRFIFPNDVSKPLTISRIYTDDDGNTITLNPCILLSYSNLPEISTSEIDSWFEAT